MAEYIDPTATTVTSGPDQAAIADLLQQWLGGAAPGGPAGAVWSVLRQQRPRIVGGEPIPSLTPAPAQSSQGAAEGGQSVAPAPGSTVTSGPDPSAPAPTYTDRGIPVPQGSLGTTNKGTPAPATSAASPAPASDLQSSLPAILASLRAQSPATFRYGDLFTSDRGDAAKATGPSTDNVGWHNDLYGLNAPEVRSSSPQEWQSVWNGGLKQFEDYQQRVYGAKNMFPLVLAVLASGLAPLFGPALGAGLGLTGSAATLGGDALASALGGTVSSALTGGDPLKGALLGGLGGGLGALGGAGLGSLLGNFGGAAGDAGAMLAGTAGSDVLGAAGELSPLVVTASGGLSGLGAAGGALGSAAGGLGDIADARAASAARELPQPGQTPNFLNPNPGGPPVNYDPATSFRNFAPIFPAGYVPGSVPDFSGPPAGGAATGGAGGGDNTLSPVTVTGSGSPPIDVASILSSIPGLINTPDILNAAGNNINTQPDKNAGKSLIDALKALNPQTPPSVFGGGFFSPGGAFGPNPFGGGSPGGSTGPGATGSPGGSGSPSGPDLGPGGSPGGGIPSIVGGAGAPGAAVTGSPFGGGAGAAGLGQISIKGSAAPDIYPWSTLSGGGL